MCGERSLKVFIEETFQLICGLRKKTFAKSNLVVRAKNVKLIEIFFFSTERFSFFVVLF